jgi:hypothetical protein
MTPGELVVRRTWIDAARDAVGDLAAWLGGLDWLTDAAWVLTLGCLGCAILDSYTSLCVVGGSLGHVGSAAACPDFGGWDTRVFPIAVDAGWAGALFAVLRLARVIGFGNWRWWVVLLFDVLTAAFTIAGNAFHGAVVDGATAQLSGAWMVAISSVASAVPGVVAVGSGFTLSVLVSARPPALAPETEPVHRDQHEASVRPESTAKPVPRRSTADGGRSSGRGSGRLPASDVLAMVRGAREHLAAEQGREPSDNDIATLLTAGGHRISASRTRTYLAQLRSAAESSEPDTEEMA